MAEKKKSIPAGISLAAGITAGAVEGTITYPTEYIKTQLQIQKDNKFLGPIDCLIKTVREKGVLGLYRGLSALVIGNAAKAGVRFLTFDQIKGLFADKNGKVSAVGMVLSGLSAGVAEAVLVVTPSETIKTKLIHDQNSPNPRFRGLVHGVRTIVAEEGMAGAYKGVSAVVARQGANSAVRMSSYGLIKDKLATHYPVDCKGKPIVPWYTTFFTGAIAGVITVYTTMPFDVVKTRLQSLNASQYNSFADCFTKVLRNEGVSALWKGATPRLGRLIFSGGIHSESHRMTLHNSKAVQISAIGLVILLSALLFKKKQVSPHEEYYSPDYQSARDKFRAASNGKGETYQLQVTEKHTTDVLVVPGSKSKLLIIISGTHGVEGFAGSAIQLAILKKFLFKSEHPTVVFVHALNPFGMAELRRWNENGVDLNRNYLSKDEFAKLRASDPNVNGYVDMYDILNPKTVPGRWTDLFYIKSLYYILKFGYLAAKRAIVCGNYHFENSLFFGGFELQKSHLLLTEFLNKHIDVDAVQKLGMIDIHTGLGPSGHDTLMIEPRGTDIMKSKSVDKEFLSHAVSAGDANDDASSGYDAVNGTIISGVPKLFKNAQYNALVTQEFGTVSNLTVLKALRAEAAAYRLSKEDSRGHDKVVRDVFYSRNDPKWKTSVVDRGIRVFEQVYNSLNE
ncbi:hypothetical protein HDV01_004383 [Terramyces sp. JEL0728]|nr:hypothetical protein HDV01_004383 [Terramyces sp. JEL0728]